MANTFIDFALVGLVVVIVAVLLRFRAATPDGLQYYMTLSRQAGYDPDRLQPLFLASKVIAALLLPLLPSLVLQSVPGLVTMVILAVIGFMLPDLILLLQRNARRTRILQSLSFYLDLVVSFLRSGLTLEESVNRAAVRGFPETHPLAREVKLVSDEMAVGKDRSAAFGALARRTNLPDLHAIASALELGSRLGFPVADLLATQADLQRDRRADRGRKRIDRAMILALFPVILCGFPLFILVVVFPTVMQIFDTIKMMKGLFG